MNIHPLFVHFPIGILVLYTAFEIFRFSFIINRHSYFEIKTILVIIGTITAYLSASTGDMAEKVIKITDPTKMPLVEIHSLYAGLTITVFSLLASAYLIEWCKRNNILEIITKIKVLYQMVYYFEIITSLGFYWSSYYHYHWCFGSDHCIWTKCGPIG